MNVSTEDLPDLDVPALLARYTTAHPQDPAVTADDLLTAVRAAYPEYERQAVAETELEHVAAKPVQQVVKPNAEIVRPNGRASSRPTTKANVSEGVQRQHNSTGRGRASGIFAEFASAWKDLGPGGAEFYGITPRVEDRPRVQGRGLKVLGWGFGV